MKNMEEIQSALNQKTDLKDIDFRVQSISDKGFCTVLGYKDARYDQKRLDEIFGWNKWGCDYSEHKGILFCSVWVICPETGERIVKTNAGSESNSDSEKGNASDAFKRACFLLGLGRDLYDLPRISFMLCPNEFQGKNKPTFDFRLDKWQWKYNDKGTLFGMDDKERIRYQSDKDFNGAPQ